MEPPRVPAVLPLVEVTFEVDGSAAIAVDGALYVAGTSVKRSALAEVLKGIATQRGPVRVHVTESDGSEFTDVIVPGADADEPPSSGTRAPAIAGNGFLPDENVDVAVVVAQQKADSAGAARMRIPPALLADRACAVVLIGRISGAVTICEPT